MKIDEIPIVMATDDGFVNYCYVAITSIIKHKNVNIKYKIHIFETSLSSENVKKLEELSSDNLQVSCVDINDIIEKKVFMSTKYLSIETYYRLYIPLVLNEYNKVLYLDSDICVLSDVAELYNMDLKGNSVGAVKDISTANIESHSKDLGIKDYQDTINAGILLIDIEKFESEKIREKCLNLLMEDNKRPVRKFIWADQDALNIVLHKKITFLDDIWNCQVQYLRRLQVVYDGCREQYLNNIRNARILHFAGGDKLWFYPEYDQAKVFWEYAKDTPVFDELLKRAIEKARTMTFERYHFPYDLIPYGSRLVLYGAGKVGQMLFQQIELSGYAKVVLWADMKWETVNENLNVVSPERIAYCEYDYVLLAIDRKEIADKVRIDLIGYDISVDKIVWKQYGTVV